jgi:hypothetical protein
LIRDCEKEFSRFGIQKSDARLYSFHPYPPPLIKEDKGVG